ncbi:hypothetical protein [Lactobacillus sp. PSON]|uniref:hypothetical protein n=1 Tax=Lactobacillus sp. PSON TaxID=3455454 RepID=UPI00404101AE
MTIRLKDKVQELTPSEKLVYSFLPRGNMNAVSLEYLANVTHLSTRAIIDIINRLVMLGLPVASSQSNGNDSKSGYYKYSSIDEFESDIHTIEGRLKTTSQKLNAKRTALAIMGDDFFKDDIPVLAGQNTEQLEFKFVYHSKGESNNAIDVRSRINSKDSRISN